MSYKLLAWSVLEDALEDLQSKNRLDKSSAIKFFNCEDYEDWAFLAMLDPESIKQKAISRITT